MIVQFKRPVQYREDVIAFVPISFDDGMLSYIENKIRELEFNHIINLGEDYEKRFAYIYLSDVHDSDYANMYLSEFAASLIDVCKFGEVILQEKYMYKSLSTYILEALDDINDSMFKIAEAINLRFEDHREAAIVYDEAIQYIEHAINETTNSHIYNYDIKHSDYIWKVSFWVLKCDVESIPDKNYMEDLLNKLPVTWKII